MINKTVMRDGLQFTDGRSSIVTDCCYIWRAILPGVYLSSVEQVVLSVRRRVSVPSLPSSRARSYDAASCLSCYVLTYARYGTPGDALPPPGPVRPYLVPLQFPSYFPLADPSPLVFQIPLRPRVAAPRRVESDRTKRSQGGGGVKSHRHNKIQRYSG